MTFFKELFEEFNDLGGFQELLSITLKLVLSCLLGAVFGFERELRSKPAGYITFLLVSLGSCLFAILQSNVVGTSSLDKTRIIAQVVSGVGFLGAGTILHNRGSVKGITTAALLWVSAGIGLLVGTGGILNIITALIATLVLYPIALVSRKFSRKIFNKMQIHKILIVFEDNKEKDLFDYFNNNKIYIEKSFFKSKNIVDNIYYKGIYVYLKVPRKIDFEEFISNLSSYDWIKSIEIV